MTVVNQNLPIPAEYLKSSEKFSIVWNDYVNREEEAKKEVMNMIKILESNGYSRTKAVAKIISDHQHLKGFSRATIYRELPDDMKRKYESSNIIMLPDYSDVSNETFIDEDGNEVFVVDDTPSTNEIKFRTEDVTDKVMEMLRLDSIAMKQRMNDEIRRNKILEQLPKDVAEKAKECRLSTDKLEILIKNKGLQKYPELQKHLIDKIKDTKRIIEEVKISDDKARDIVAQTCRDLETGAIVPDGSGSYAMNYYNREKIEKHPERVKQPLDYFLQFQQKSFPEMMHLLTGYRLTEDEIKYEPNHVDNTIKYRQEMVDSLTEKEKDLLYENVEMLRDVLDSLIHIINNEIPTSKE